MHIPLVYAPLLHKSLVPLSLPPEVAFFPTGLPLKPDATFTGGDAKIPVATAALQDLMREALPFTGAKARAVLDDLTRMGEIFGLEGALRQRAAGELFGEGWSVTSEKSSEFAELERFAATGKALPACPRVSSDWGGRAASSSGNDPATVQREVAICQKVLLLCYSLEEAHMELARLQAGSHRFEQSLRAALGELQSGNTVKRVGDEDEASLGDPVNSPLYDVSWQVMLDAALPFLPENGILFTADTRMATDLLEAGMLQPFPEDRADICAGWDQKLVGGLLCACLPAWRLVGRRSVPPGRPWLNRELEILVARPEGGWMRSGHSCLLPERKASPEKK